MDINELVNITSGLCGELALNEEVWRSFSFKKKPKRGAYFNRFIPKDQFSMEQFLRKELIAINFTDMSSVIRDNLYEMKAQLDDLDWKLRSSAREGVILAGTIDRIWNWKLFKDVKEYTTQLIEADKYSSLNNTEKSSLLAQRMSSVSDYLTKAAIKAGSDYFFNASNYSRIREIRLKEYKQLISSNELEGILKMTVDETIGKKFIKSAQTLLRIEDE